MTTSLPPTPRSRSRLLHYFGTAFVLSATVGAGLLGICLGSLSLLQSKLIYLPTKYNQQPTYQALLKYKTKLGLEQIRYRTSQGENQVAYYWPINRNGGGGTGSPTPRSRSRLLHYFGTAFVLSATVGAGLLGICLGSLSLLQSKLIYLPTKYNQQPTYQALLKYKTKLGLEQIRYRTSQGENQVAYYWPINRNGGGGTGSSTSSASSTPSSSTSSSCSRVWVLSGGNAHCALDWLRPNDFIDQYQQRISQSQYYYTNPSSSSSTSSSSSSCSSEGMLLIDMPLYGQNEGHPNPETVKENTIAAIDAAISWLDQRGGGVGGGTPQEKQQYRLGFLGHSMGNSANLMYVAHHLQQIVTKPDSASSSSSAVSLPPSPSSSPRLLIEKVICLSPFSTLLAMAQRLFGSLPFLSILLKHQYDNIKSMESIVNAYEQDDDGGSGGERKLGQLNMLIMHGAADELIPVSMSEELYQVVASKTSSSSQTGIAVTSPSSTSSSSTSAASSSSTTPSLSKAQRGSFRQRSSGNRIRVAFEELPGVDHNSILWTASRKVFAEMEDESN